ncbi:MAG: FkbM family methyltransferase [Verrucomicrobiota bacterium]
MDEHLAEGAVFIDVGAHVGVYSVLAAKRVGSQGKVFAIEPQSVGIAAIEISAALNGFTHLHAILGAVGKTAGLIPLDLESFGAAVVDQSRARENSTLVQCLALDDLATQNSLAKIHLLKLDAGGNEAEVLLGAKELLRSRQLQAIVMKLYHPDVIHQRFGKTTWDAIAWLHSHEYTTDAVFHGKVLGLQAVEDLSKIFSDGSYCHILIARPA